MTNRFREYWCKDPFLIIGGESHNSNSSGAAAMEEVWQKADSLCLNTLLLPVSWEMTEPEEGRFDFSCVDMLLRGARDHGKRLVLLWFGSWKNGQCSYAPAWVKKDPSRFARAQVTKGLHKVQLPDLGNMGYSTLSYLCAQTCRADARAFAALMAHLARVDSRTRTVYMVQVENETGLLGAAREHSDAADAAFYGPVDAGLLAYLKQNTAQMAADVRAAVEAAPNAGSWCEVFGPVAEEIFSAYHVASYVDQVAAAGRAQYDLPMYVNCWLDKGQCPGQYPSGGPVARMMEVWQYCASHIDFFAPDIYVPNFCGMCEQYQKRGNTLFIPETFTHSQAGPRLVYAVGHFHALGYAPFGFEEMGSRFSNSAAFLFGMDLNDAQLSTVQNTAEYAWFARTLNGLMPLLVERYGSPRLQAVIHEQPDKSQLHFYRFGFLVETEHPSLSRSDGVCLGMELPDDEFLLVACGCRITPFSCREDLPHTDIILMEEGSFENGAWATLRRLNGDEVVNPTFDSPVLLRVRLYAYR